ncbi:MAG TPA: adenylosuccinate lyase [candidate division Zixibacteria bacterium]
MIPRYSLPKMQNIWSEQNKFEKWLEIEILACEAQAKFGNIPRSALLQIKRKAKFNAQRIEKIEEKTKHDVVAFLTNLAENIGPESKYVHLGMTSSDILDTSLSVLMREAGQLIKEDLRNLKTIVKKKALKYKYTPIIGRTHGVHAEPTTLGLKFALWYDEIKRDIERLERAIETISFGKISGAVGNFANIDPKVEKYVCQELGLKPAPVSNQILQRDRHAEYMTTLAIIAGSIEKFCTEIRNLGRTEILEMEEPFTKGQKGSSAMPHKRNPILCERLCGMARLVKSHALASLDNMALWHERDISHSSVERIIIPDSTILINYMLNKFIYMIDNLMIYPENMLKNINSTRGLVFSQRVLLRLIEKGLTREVAYQVVQKNAMQAWETGKSFEDLISKDKETRKCLSLKEINSCFDIGFYLEKVDYIFKRVFRG